MEEKKTEEQVTMQEPETEQGRREFISKLVTVAGAAAIAGLAGAAGSEASADVGKSEHKTTTEFKMGKFRNGFTMNLSGRQIGEALRQLGLVGQDANLDAAMINIEFRA